MKEILFISDKGGAGKSLVFNHTRIKHMSSGVYADCSFTNKVTEELPNSYEEYFNLGKEPVSDNNLCLFCGDCASICEFLAIDMRGDGIILDRQKCAGCGHCCYICPAGAIQMKNIRAGKIIITIDKQYGYFVHGILQHYPRNGIRPVSIIRNKAFDLANELKTKYLFVKAPPGWNVVTQSLVYQSSQIVAVIEPHNQVLEFLGNLEKIYREYPTNIVVLITKADLNYPVTNKILLKYRNWETHCIPWQDTLEPERYTNINFIADEN